MCMSNSSSQVGVALMLPHAELKHPLPVAFTLALKLLATASPQAPNKIKVVSKAARMAAVGCSGVQGAIGLPLGQEGWEVMAATGCLQE